MGTTQGDEFYKKVYPILSDIAFENDFQIVKSSSTIQGLTRPATSFFKATTWLARLPKNMDIMRLLLKFLKALGQAPFCHDSNTTTYYFSWLSFDTAMCFAVSLIAMFAWFVFTSHLVFKKFLVFGPGIRSRLNALEETLKSNSDMDEHQIQANIHGLAIMDTCIALSQLVHIISGWQNRHKLVVIMNQWTRLERSLKTILHEYSWANADAWVEAGKYYCRITLVAAIVLLTTMSPFLLGIIAPSEPDQTLEFALMPVIFAYYGITEASQDAVVNLMFYELSKSMQLVRQQILLDVERGTVSENRIWTWRRIILSIRQQADRISDYISTPQLFLLLQSLVLGTMAIFVALMNGCGTDSAGIQTASLGLFVWVLIRLFLKAYMAEKITVAEALVAAELLDWNVQASVSTEAEIRDLRNLLLSHPMKINLGNIIILRRGVCLTVISQIVTYLIVLIQFYNQK